MLSTYQNDLYLVKNGRNHVSLVYEYRLDGRAYYRRVKGMVYGWRKDVFLDFARRLKVGKEEEVRDYQRGSRLSVFIRILPEIDGVREAHKAMNIVMEMGLEESAFWVNKFNIHGKDGVRAFKAMYRVK